MKITANKYVAVTYDLNVGEGEERELMEKATVEAPLKFIYGTGMMLPAFEKALNGLEVGGTFNFSIEPAEAYGEYNEEHVLDLPKNIFEVDGKFDAEMIKEGNTVPMMDSNGNRMNGSVLEVKDGLQPSVGWRDFAFQRRGNRRTRTDSGRDRSLLRSRRWM